MKWNDVYILLIGDDDNVVVNSANGYRRRYQVPPEKCFVDKDYPTPPVGFSQLDNSSLSASTLGSKIIIICHSMFVGIRHWYDRLDGASFAKYLYQETGLRNAGLITFKGCELGQDTFLSDFRAHMDPMNIGWLIGYKESITTKVFDDYACEVIDSDLQAFEISRSHKSPDGQRVSIVKGNCHVIPPKGSSTRYQ